jgi:hypothetical protein
MLFFETIDSRTLELLIKLQKASVFTDLRLVGGTGLALQIGHRKSIDIDLFGSLTADEYEISRQLTEIGNTTVLRKTKNINVYVVEGIKVDIYLFFLLRHFSLNQMLGFYSQKYSDSSEFLVLKSLAYFEDADTDEDPVMLKTGNWLKIKSFIKSTLEGYIK